ncbi:ankyrin repeat domain-containing protein [bacterium]|nr:ankyrin repeat domain-containing protein [bacterium]
MSPRDVPSFDEPLPAGAIPTTDLEYWAALGQAERVAEVLATAPDPNIRGVGGYTAAHAAAENGHLEVLRLLVTRGADVCAQLDTGETPLALATGHPDVVVYLQSVGAR